MGLYEVLYLEFQYFRGQHLCEFKIGILELRNLNVHIKEGLDGSVLEIIFDTHSWIPTSNPHTPLVLQSRGCISD